MTIEQMLQAAAEHHDAGRLDEAEALYREVLREQPGEVDALHYLGLLCFQTGRNVESLQLIEKAAGLRRDDSEIASALARVLAALGRNGDSIAAWRRSLELEPDRAEGWMALGVALRRGGQNEEAVEAYQHAAKIRADYAEAFCNLTMALRDLGRSEEAFEAATRAVAIRPQFAAAQNNLGIVLRDRGQNDEAIEAWRRAISLEPNLLEAYRNLGNLLASDGQIDAAVECFDRRLEIRPDSAVHSAKIFAMLFSERAEGQEILRECRTWDDRYARSLAGTARSHANDRSPDRKLRIGYVSPHFGRTTVGWNLLPLLEHRDRAGFEVYCYSSIEKPDEITRRLHGLADAWREIGKISDADAVEMIRADRIDVLVDLALHTAGSRLLIFAREPAPVQATFMGYPGTTGLAAMDYRLTDPWLDPPGRFDGDYSERSVRLPNTFWCFDPTADAVPADVVAGPLPALSSGFVTFGCLNTFCKISDASLRLWAKVLRAVAGSRLLLLAPAGSGRERVVGKLAAAGVESNRVEFVGRKPRADYLRIYNRIDIGLDTIPYNGHTTGIEAHWMGVPVVTRTGSTVVSRAGFSLLSNLGLSELAADSDERFVEIAAALASDIPRLGELRAGLRDRMERSALMDGPAFAQNVEAVYRMMWREWCAR